MSKNPLPPQELLERIHFDTLLEQATEVVRTHAAVSWTDLAVHDPGITLLETLAFGVSDVAYRHALPLKDLLTPSPEEPREEQTIFPADFGPHQALTCGPITEDDYRRALLDLHTSDAPGRTEDESASTFYFRNVQLEREAPEDQFRYWYNAAQQQYRFQPTDAAELEEDEAGETGSDTTRPTRPVVGNETEMTVLGGYHLYVELNRGVTREQAEIMLQTFLHDHRNLCEAVRRITWLQPQTVEVWLDVELDDDCRTPAQVLADVYRVVEGYIRPDVPRYRASDLQEQGWINEDIYQGPRLLHGWIPGLPPRLDYQHGAIVNLSPLSNQLLDIDGIRSIRSLGFGEAGEQNNWELMLAPGRYPLLWGVDPIDTLAAADSPVRLLKRGQQLRASAEEIRAALPPQDPIFEEAVVMPVSRYRHPGEYHSASERLPPCYGLQDPEPELVQTHLHQFMLPFEQELANACDQLALLPMLLAFDRLDREPDDRTVWGWQWPFRRDRETDDIANAVHQDYRETLEEVIMQQSQDTEKELACIDYLLGYFGATRAPRILLPPVTEDDFLTSQRAYLQQQTILAYDRASIKVNEVSAWHRRIGARLGMSPSMFLERGEGTDYLAELPFYVIEHRMLVPEAPHPVYNEKRELENPFVLPPDGTGDEPMDFFITVTKEADSKGDKILFKAGQTIDFFLHEGDSTGIGPCLIREVIDDNAKMVLRFDLTDQRRLKAKYGQILEAFDEGRLRWSNSIIWLQDVHYDLKYAAQQPANTSLKRIASEPYPATLKKGDEIVLYSYDARQVFPDGVNLTDSPRAFVKEVDPIRGEFDAELTGGTWPDLADTDGFINGSAFPNYRWYVNRSGQPVNDQFSFALSVVFPRSLLNNTVEPYVTQAWIQQLVMEELPCHVSAQVHWFDGDFDGGAYGNFAKTYKVWQNHGAPLGDRSYDLMWQLALGWIPDLRGINAMRIAFEWQEDELPEVESSYEEWKAYVDEYELLYVYMAAPGTEES